jgi:hypothetical protein
VLEWRSDRYLQLTSEGCTLSENISSRGVVRVWYFVLGFVSCVRRIQANVDDGEGVSPCRGVEPVAFD